MWEIVGRLCAAAAGARPGWGVFKLIQPPTTRTPPAPTPTEGLASRCRHSACGFTMQPWLHCGGQRGARGAGKPRPTLAPLNPTAPPPRAFCTAAKPRCRDHVGVAFYYYQACVQRAMARRAHPPDACLGCISRGVGQPCWRRRSFRACERGPAGGSVNTHTHMPFGDVGGSTR